MLKKDNRFKNKYLLAIVLVIGVIFMGLVSKVDQDFHFIITETGEMTSLDPLDGDQTQNLSVQRMIYATPVEVDQNGKLTSSLLSDFSYDEASAKMKWTVKEGIQFSNGTEIKAEDVAFAVIRMAFKRPQFPVIEKIKGISDWVKQEFPLTSSPSGVSVNGNVIEIQFTENVNHPLFRFGLELFSVIPKNCVDLKTNAITCKDIPFSGHYQLVQKQKNQLDFEIRNESKLKGSVANKIQFQYRTASEVFSDTAKLPDNSIIQGNEIKLSLEEHKYLTNKLSTSFLPAARIALNLLNPNIGAFKNRKCRLVYAEAYRQAFSELTNGDYKVESSVFTDVIAGYRTSEDLRGEYNALSKSEVENCISEIRRNPPRWAQTEDQSDEVFRLIAQKTLELLGVENVTPLKLTDRKSEIEAFIKGDISVMGASTGFWALDPAGDIQMLLTPNMHKLLQFVSNNDQLQKMIQELDGSTLAFEALNQYIYNDAKMNIFAHVRRFYASSKEGSISELPMSITSPAPWQVFNLSK